MCVRPYAQCEDGPLSCHGDKDYCITEDALRHPRTKAQKEKFYIQGHSVGGQQDTFMLYKQQIYMT